jgi:hypothetical protein
VQKKNAQKNLIGTKIQVPGRVPGSAVGNAGGGSSAAAMLNRNPLLNRSPLLGRNVASIIKQPSIGFKQFTKLKKQKILKKSRKKADETHIDFRLDLQFRIVCTNRMD